MKYTKKQLDRIIREELNEVIDEGIDPFQLELKKIENMIKQGLEFQRISAETGTEFKSYLRDGNKMGLFKNSFEKLYSGLSDKGKFYMRENLILYRATPEGGGLISWMLDRAETMDRDSPPLDREFRK